MSNAIRCPECGSSNVECVEKPHHDHICHDCGHTLLPRSSGEGASQPQPDTPDLTGLFAALDKYERMLGDFARAEVLAEVRKLRAATEEDR